MFYLSYPAGLRSEVIPNLPIRWYGVMYIIAFFLTYLIVKLQVKRNEISLDDEEIDDLFMKGILGLLLGARLFSWLIYDGCIYNWTHPWMAFWPFRDGHFVGLAGMSYHGGVVGCIIGVWIFSRRRSRSFFEIADTLSLGIPLGYTFGRLGNFINGELWGRVSVRPWAMVFPYAPRFSTSLEWVRDVCKQLSIEYTPGELVNFPRHPSQLYEMFFEGIVLFLILWFVLKRFRNRQPSGYLFASYIGGYGIIRFVIEYFREPDPQFGFIIRKGAGSSNPALFTSLFNISVGQIFCLMMVVAAVVLYIIRRKECHTDD